jgi:hypothetical protein
MKRFNSAVKSRETSFAYRRCFGRGREEIGTVWDSWREVERKLRG